MFNADNLTQKVAFPALDFISLNVIWLNMKDETDTDE